MALCINLHPICLAVPYAINIRGCYLIWMASLIFLPHVIDPRLLAFTLSSWDSYAFNLYSCASGLSPERLGQYNRHQTAIGIGYRQCFKISLSEFNAILFSLVSFYFCSSLSFLCVNHQGIFKCSIFMSTLKKCNL